MPKFFLLQNRVLKPCERKPGEFSKTPQKEKQLFKQHRRFFWTEDMRYKNATSDGIKDKRLNAHRYKKLFQIGGEKVKVSQGQIGVSDASNEKDEVLAEKSCFNSKRKRQRLCYGQGCGKSFHRSCLDPPLPSTPTGAWHCGSCNKKKNKSGVHSVSKGTEFEEYWIPVHLSCMQIEQYCSLLHSNLEALSSCLRNNSSLHDILIQTQKCCDHPYLVDPTLRKSSKRDVSVDPLDADINVSSKLQLIDKLLSEIKRCGLRVLVLFQSVVSSEKITIGDILDDLVDRRFGQDSYVRIPRKILSKSARVKKKEDLNMFNNIESGKFICLLDYHTCHSSITLSCLDVVILFNGDWNPLNDLKALQKITIDSRSERLRVLRLYSSFTIEEKALILAKQGVIFDSNPNHNWSTCQQLLAWGASYLFSKLESYTFEPSFLDDLVQKLSSSLLLNNNDDNDLLNGSVISNARLRDGTYARNILLFGENEAHAKESSSIDEYLMENEPLVFWTNLVKESHHRLKNPSGRLSRRVQKQFHYPSYWFGGFESGSGSENDAEDFEKVVKGATTSPCVKTKLTSKGKANSLEQSKLAGRHGHSGKFSENSNVNHTDVNAFVPVAPENVPSACRETNIASSRKIVPKLEQQNEGCTQIHQENLDDTGGYPQSQFCSEQRMSPPPQQGELQRESLVCNLTEQFNRSLTQPAAQVPSTYISDSIALNASRSSVQERDNNQTSETLLLRPPIFQSSSANPLETELERIQKDREQATKLRQEKKLLLLSECEKEISEIRKKYDALIEESEACSALQLKDLERNYQLVYANKLLAEMMSRIRFCYDDTLDVPLPEKETSSMRIAQIPASALRRPVSPCLTGVPTNHFHGHSLGLRGPAPHLRSNPSLFASSYNLPTVPQHQPQPQPYFLEPFPTLLTPQTPSNGGIYQELPVLPKFPLAFESFYDMGCYGLPFLGSSYGNS